MNSMHSILRIAAPCFTAGHRHARPALPSATIGIVPSVITPAEHDLLVSLCHRKLKRSAFLAAHFDKVISGYREMSASHWKVGVPASVAEENERQVRAILCKCYAVLDRVRQDARDGGEGKMVNMEGNTKWSLETGGWLAEHILELNETGTIGAHVDHLTASGTLVAALSLISSTPVVFQHVEHPEWTVEIQAEPGSLYFQMNDFRYDFTHAVPKPAGQPRISVMFRDQYVRQ
ncbi:hypothetical protein BCR44DRAFT_1441555 [Catenaria anguillulae PL171]|uniref:Alpha-ketoglutarate-dependent dioxygenase AlkB-like domain-containing protein n=1 Tax=Catenaria anguillulae PL171 TaxID=765915 RepID=A0A1Y2HAX2_9FUNG|nr:hypothetical protein BCR44DRAFT_1441555 [Catenaria anguillulae PL171]